MFNLLKYVSNAITQDQSMAHQSWLFWHQLKMVHIRATTYSNQTLTNIKFVDAKLNDLLMQYEEETTKYVGICSMMVETLKLTNNDVLESKTLPTHVGGRASRRLPPTGNHFSSGVLQRQRLGARFAPLSQL